MTSRCSRGALRPGVGDSLIDRLAVFGWVEIHALLIGGLVGLGLDGVSLSIGVATHARYLPRDLRASRAAGDLEAAAGKLLGYVKVGTRRAYGGENVAEILIGGLEPGRDGHRGCAVRVKDGIAIYH